MTNEEDHNSGIKKRRQDLQNGINEAKQIISNLKVNVEEEKWTRVDEEISNLSLSMNEMAKNKMVKGKIYSILDPNQVVDCESIKIIDEILKENNRVASVEDKDGRREYLIDLSKKKVEYV